MQDVKLWKVNQLSGDPTITEVVSAAQAETEELLEDILTKTPALLSTGLKIIGRQVETPSGPLDLLGVDEDGQLTVFELKRGVLTRDAVAQVLDYGSYVASLDAAGLTAMVVAGSGKNGVEKIDDFSDWYETEFGKPLEAFPNPDLVLVGLGVDERAKRMVEFLTGGKIQMSLITFHAFNDGNCTLLARQVEVASQQAGRITSTKAQNLEILARRLKAAQLDRIFKHISSNLRAKLADPYEWPNKSGYTYYLPDLNEDGTPINYAYLSIFAPDSPKGSLLLSIQERATKAAGEVWESVAAMFGPRLIKRKSYYDVRVPSEGDWHNIEGAVDALCAAIRAGRRKAREQKIANEEADAADATKESADTALLKANPAQ